MSEKQSIPALTGLRFFAALAIFNVHFFYPEAWGYVVPPVVSSVRASGFAGISLFFVLSGFILAYVYEGIDGSRVAREKFWGSRIARIYPVYALGLLWIAPFILYHRFDSEPAGTAIAKALASFIPSALLVQGWFHPRLAISWNGPGWTLSVEAAFYILFPFVAPHIRHMSNHAKLGVAAAAWALAFPLSTMDKLFDSPPEFLTGLIGHHFAFHLPAFISGVALGFHFLHGSASRRAGDALCLIAMAGILGIAMSADQLPVLLVRNAVFLPLFGALIYGLALGGWPSRLLSNRLVVLLGESSYAFYILQFGTVLTLMSINDRAPFHNFVRDGQVSPVLTGFGFYVAALFLSVTSSIAVFVLIETPLRKKIKRRLGILRRHEGAS